MSWLGPATQPCHPAASCRQWEVSQTKVKCIMFMGEGAISSTSIQLSMSALYVLLGEEGPQMRQILPTPPPTNRLAPKAKCRGLEFHQASSARESVAHQILLSSTCRRGVPHGRTATASALSLLRCFRGPRAGARLPCQRTSTADRNGPYATRAITWRWSRWCSSPAAQRKIFLWDCARQHWIACTRDWCFDRVI